MINVNVLSIPVLCSILVEIEKLIVNENDIDRMFDLVNQSYVIKKELNSRM